MISNFSSFVELFAAIYVTMAASNDFCSNFWTPNYYKDLEHMLNIYNFNGSSSIHANLLAEMKSRYNAVQANAHHRGAILLCLCVSYLIFMGFETETNCVVVSNYVPILYCTVIVGISVLISNVLLTKWKYVFVFILLCTITYVLLQWNEYDGINGHFISLFLYQHRFFLMIAVILLPVVYQFYLYWLYSSVYKGYLKYHVAEEYEKFNTSMEGIKNKNRGQVNELYLKAWTDAQFRRGEDSTLTLLYDELNKQLLKVASPNHWQLLFSWIKHHFRCFASRLKNLFGQNNVESKNTEIQSKANNLLEQYECPKGKTLNFSKEWQDYCVWKKTAGKNDSIRTYCKLKNIPAKDMIAWLRVNKPPRQ